MGEVVSVQIVSPTRCSGHRQHDYTLLIQTSAFPSQFPAEICKGLPSFFQLNFCLMKFWCFRTLGIQIISLCIIKKFQNLSTKDPFISCTVMIALLWSLDSLKIECSFFVLKDHRIVGFRYYRPLKANTFKVHNIDIIDRLEYFLRLLHKLLVSADQHIIKLGQRRSGRRANGPSACWAA